MFNTRLPLFAALLIAMNGVSAQRTCDDFWVSISNQTDIEFYKTCPAIAPDGGVFFINHEFKGPFELPGVESIPKLSSGYLLPKLSGSNRVDDGVTSISMPDLKSITHQGIFIGYVDNVTSLSMPKLKTITGDFGILDSNSINKISFPSLETVNGAIYLDGRFSEVNFPSLKSVSYIRIESGSSDLDCPALGKAFASVNFTGNGEDMGYRGFTCYTPYENNNWNSSEPGGGITGSSNGASGGSGDKSGKDSAASGSRVGYGVGTLLFVAGVVLSL